MIARATDELSVSSAAARASFDEARCVKGLRSGAQRGVQSGERGGAPVDPSRAIATGLRRPCWLALTSLALTSLALSACGVETGPGPGSNAGESGAESGTSGNNGQSGAAGDGGTGDAGDGMAGSSGNGAGNGAGNGSSGNGGSSGSAGDAGDAGDAGAGDGGSGDGGSGDGGSGDGGSGDGGSGDGGDPGCDSHDDCPDDAPRCGAGTCIACGDDAPCIGRENAEHCVIGTGQPNRGQCVECTAHAHCAGGEEDRCVDQECVQCETHEDCEDEPDAPQCDDGECVPCDGDGACEDHPTGPRCALSGPRDGQCVQCVDHGDCDNPTPECSGNECQPCTNDDACDDRDDATICDPSDDDTFGGTCVQCTGTRYETCTSGGTDYVCESLNRECSETAEEASGNPCDACVSDAQCKAGMACVRQMLGVQDLGTYCFYDDSVGAGCASETNPTAKPYSQQIERTSLDGTSAVYCQPRTSCQAYRDADSGKECTLASDCGVDDLDDGYCLGSGPAAGHCSYGCDEDYDCLSDLPTCSDTGVSVCAP